MKTIKSILSVALLIITINKTTAQSQRANDSLLSIVNNMNAHDTMKVKSLNVLALNHYLVSDMGKAKRYLTQSLVISEKINYTRGKSVANTILSNVEMYNNNYDNVLECSFRALQFYKQINDTTSQNFINNLNSIATVYSQSGTFDKSLQYYIRALRICDHIKNKNLIIIFNNNIANLYKNKLEYDKAITYYENVLKQSDRKEDTLGIYPNVFFGFGDIYFSKNYYNKSLSYYKRAFNIGQFIKDSSYMCSANIGIANVYKAQNKFDTAIKYLNSSLLYNDNERNANGYLSLGEIYMAQKKYKLAQLNLNKSLSLSKLINFKNIICSNYKNLYQLDSCIKNYFGSMQNHKLYIAYRDSIYNNMEGERKIVSTELNYKFDKEKAYMEFQQEEKDTRNNMIITGVVILLLFLTIICFIIYKSYSQKNKAHKIITHQKHLVDEKQKEILDNITYAKRIQSSLMPSNDYINRYTKENFVFYKPKDIVSGDFYWATDYNGEFYLVAADCTGHGVSGSMMSMLNMSALNETVNHRKITDTGEILNKVRKEIIKSLNPNGNEGVNDGMDCVLCKFDFRYKTLQYSAANNSFYIIRNNKIITCKADKMPVGLGIKTDSFTTNTVQLQENDIVYMFTDGFPDQFGGEKNKKFNYKRFEELLLSVCDRPMEEQKKAISVTFDYWKGHYEQTDDVLVIGVKI